GSAFAVVVTNAAGSAISTSATLTVTNIVAVTPPTISSAALGTGGFAFQASLPQGTTYVILASSDLMNWTPIATNVAQGNTEIFVDPAAINLPSRFYRIALQ